MAHPRRYQDDDPYLGELRRVCLGLPEAVEVEAWGMPTFRVGKIFAIFEPSDDRRSVIFKPDPEERPALLADPRCYPPPYWGASGWLGLDVTAADIDWSEIAELVECSYRLVARKGLVAELDRRRAGQP